MSIAAPRNRTIFSAYVVLAGMGGAIAAACVALVVTDSVLPEEQLDGLDAQLVEVASHGSAPPACPGGKNLDAKPLLALQSSPGPSVAEISLVGIAAAGQRRSALIAIRSGAPVWRSIGETFEGVTLRAVEHDRILVNVDGANLPITLADGARVGPNQSASTAATHSASAHDSAYGSH